MGLLDDAIREHLELKRRRGADPEEIARQEREALGPIRRTSGAEPDAEAAARDDAPEVGPAAGSAERERARETKPAAGEPPAAPEDAVRAGDDVAPPPDAGRDGPPAREREPDVNWREPPRRAGDAGEPADRTPDDDVLEETPDFLQETPEHDRLWFEQRPPRDFDF